MISIDTKKPNILFFSDLHLGIHQDSQVWHEIALEFAHTLLGWITDKDIDTIIMAGDVFHDRHEIGVNTLHIAKKFFDIITSNGAEVYIIPGNHDSYLSTSTEINSVAVLENKLIKVIEHCEIATVRHTGKTIGFCPWHQNFLEVSDCVDLLVGHFEISNFKITSGRVCDFGQDATTLLSIAPKVVSGHFHIRDHREYEDGKYVLYLGSPFQMDFGDRGFERGATLIDTESMEVVEWLKNDKSPKHHKITLTELVSLMEDKEEIQKIISNNFISICVDVEIDTWTVDKLCARLQSFGPKQMRVEFNVIEKALNTEAAPERFSIDIESAFHEFVELLEDTKNDKSDVTKKCIELYKQCLQSND